MDELKELIAQCDKCHSLGVYFDGRRIENFNLSRNYKPNKIKVLWIVESPPLSDPPRYFYRPELTRYDGLFREIIKVLGIPVSNPKDESLRRFSELGHFLIDAMKCPADKQNGSLKPTMIKNCSAIFAREILDINPDRIIIVKADIHTAVYATVASIDMSNRVLNEQSIPFPGSGQQVRFRNAVEKLLKLGDKPMVTKNYNPLIQATMSKSIIANNITESDISSNQLRITIANKHLFPSEKVGQPQVYNIKLVYNGNDFSCTYRIGSKDGKSRSGVLKLGSGLVSSMRLRSTDLITISVLAAGKYEIRKN